MDFIQDLNYLRRPQNMFIDNFQTYLLDSVMGITFYMMNIFVLWLVCFSSIIRIGTVFQKGRHCVSEGYWWHIPPIFVQHA